MVQHKWITFRGLEADEISNQLFLLRVRGNFNKAATKLEVCLCRMSKIRSLLCFTYRKCNNNCTLFGLPWFQNYFPIHSNPRDIKKYLLMSYKLRIQPTSYKVNHNTTNFYLKQKYLKIRQIQRYKTVYLTLIRERITTLPHSHEALRIILSNKKNGEIYNYTLNQRVF